MRNVEGFDICRVVVHNYRAFGNVFLPSSVRVRFGGPYPIGVEIEIFSS